MNQQSNSEETSTLNQSFKKVKDFLVEVNGVLGSAVKPFSFASGAVFLIGVLVLWNYLRSFGLLKLFYEVFSSPQILLMLALISILLTASFVLLTVISPLAYRYAESTLPLRSEDINTDKKRRGKFGFDFAIFFVCIGLPIVLSIFSQLPSVRPVNEDNLISFILWLWAISTSIFILIKISRRFQNSNIDSLIGSTLFFLLAFSGLYLPLLLSLGLMQELALESDFLEWLVFFILLFIYALIASASVNMENAVFGPIGIAIFFTVLIFVISPGIVIQTAIESAGVGKYQTTISVNSQHQPLLNQNEAVIGKCSSEGEDDHLLCREVWIIADLPANIAIADKSEAEKLTILPQSAVLGREVKLDN